MTGGTVHRGGSAAALAWMTEPEDQQALLAAIVDSSFDAIIGKTLDGTITSWNAAAERMYGHAAHEVIGRSIEVIVPPERLDELTRVYQRLRRGERIEPFETERVAKDGRRLEVALSISPIRDRSGTTVGASAIARDITERRQAERQLRRSQHQLSDLVENSAIGIHWVGPDGTLLWANRAELELLGYAQDEYVGRHIAEFHVDGPVIEDILERLGRDEELRSYEARVRCRDGSIRHVLISSNVYREDGRFVHTRCFTSDISERRQTAIVIEGQKRALELIAQGAPLAAVLEVLVQCFEEQSLDGGIASIFLASDDGRHLRLSAAPSMPESYNRAVDGVAIGAVAGSCGTSAHRREPVIVADIASDPLWRDWRDVALRHGLRACWSFPILAGEDRVLGTYAIYYRDPREPTPRDLQILGMLSRTAAIAIEARRAEAALRESERHLRQVLDSLGALVLVTTPGGRVIEANRSALDLASLAAADVLGRPLEETYWWSFAPEEQTRLREAIARAARGQGSRYDARLRVGPERHITVDFMLTPLVDPHGQVTHLIPSAIDITARKQAERQQQMLVEELNHRVKNTLAAVQSVAMQTLSSSSSPDHFAAAFSGRLAALASAHSLLAQARWEGAGLHDLIRAQVEPYQSLDGHKVRLHGDDASLEPGTALTLGLALHELATNAAKHGALASPGGHIEIGTEMLAGAGSRRLRLVWRERGGRAIAGPRRTGFGLTMIERGVAYQLKGVVRLELPPAGLHCAIEFPLADGTPAEPGSGWGGSELGGETG